MSGQAPVKVQPSSAILPQHISPLYTAPPLPPTGALPPADKLTVTQLRASNALSSEHSRDSSSGSQPGRAPLAAAPPLEVQAPYMSLASGADSGSQLPLFQANQTAMPAGGDVNGSTAQSSGSTRVSSDPLAPAPAAAAPTPPPRVSARGAAAGKRTAERTADSTRKQARLTGFAARMSGTSAYRGVSWHTQTSRWKAQIKVAGKDVNLGRHRDEVDAARAYDRAAICARGEKDAKLNFALTDYQHEVASLTGMPLSDLAASLRGVEQRLQAQTSRYHGVRLNKRTQKWEAYIRVAGKHVHLGCYDSEVAAAQAFDQAALVRQAHNLGAMGGKPQLVTNFPPMIYLEFTNQLFQLANPLAAGKDVGFNEGAANPGYCRLDDKYVQNLLCKCQEQGGSLTAYPSIAS